MKIILRAVPILLTGLVLSPASYSSNLDKNELAIKCEAVANKLYDLSQTKAEEHCASDVELAGGYTEFAGQMISSGNNNRGFSSLKSAERELRKVQSATNYCAYFSPLVKPYLDDVIKLQSELGTNPSFK